MTAKKKPKPFNAEYLFAAVLLIVAAVVISWQFNTSDEISGMSVQGDRMSDASEVLERSGLAEGMHGDSIVFLDVIERIETLPWIRMAHVNLTPSGQVRIRVEEEEPMALLVDRGRNALVTESGMTMPVVLGHRVDVPILYGFEVSNTFWETGTPDTLRSESFEKVRSFLTEATRYPGLYAMISEVMVTDDDGVVVLSDENAVRLTFGHEDFDDRLRKWQAFQSQVISRKGISQVRSLDFRYRGQVVAMEQ